MTKDTASQNNEAEIVINYFGDKVGTLLSLGENDGKTLSNSYDLIKLGWGADLFEPVPTANMNCYLLHKENPKVNSYQMGVDKTAGKKLFYLTEDTLVASLNKELALSWGSKYTEVYLYFIEPKQITGVTGNNKYEFITIDCEGSDLAILEQLDLAKLGCECICLEHGNSEPNYKRMKQICNSHGLNKELLRNFENVIFAI